MKIARWVIRILAVLMLPLLLFFALNSGWWLRPTERSRFTDVQRDEICQALKFELAPGEKLKTRYWPGFLQATIHLTVTVCGITSEEEFVKRFHGEWIEVQDRDENIDLFHLTGYIKDYECILIIDDAQAKFYIGGYIPQLNNIYKFLYEPWQPYLANPYLLGGIALELGLIITLIVLRRKAKKDKPLAGDGLPDAPGS